MKQSTERGEKDGAYAMFTISELQYHTVALFFFSLALSLARSLSLFLSHALSLSFTLHVGDSTVFVHCLTQCTQYLRQVHKNVHTILASILQKMSSWKYSNSSRATVVRVLNGPPQREPQHEPNHSSSMSSQLSNDACTLYNCIK